MNKHFFYFLWFFLTSYANADIVHLPLPYGGIFSTHMPCMGQRISVNSAVGVTNAVQCRMERSDSVCIFMMVEQPLDITSYNKLGFKFIEMVHQQYAQQMDKNYRNINQSIVNLKGLGNVLQYEILRSQEGVAVNVKGGWLVANDSMLRTTVSCAPNGTDFLKNERDIFLRSAIVINHRK